MAAVAFRMSGWRTARAGPPLALTRLAGRPELRRLSENMSHGQAGTGTARQYDTGLVHAVPVGSSFRRQTALTAVRSIVRLARCHGVLIDRLSQS